MHALPDGLLLRLAQDGDVDQIAELLAARGEAADAHDLRLVVDDPDAGLEAVGVVVDGDRVVSTATLLDETVLVRHPGGVIELPGGQVELVATDREYEGRGLVRALMAWAHGRSIERGHDIQVMVGIPYFYRRFGYEYAIDIPPAREVVTMPAARPGTRVRVAGPGDAPAMARLQSGAQASSDVAMPRSAAEWRWTLAGTGTTTWVAERAGEVVATGRSSAGDEAVLTEPAAVDPDAALALLHGVAATSVVERPGTVSAAARADLLAPADGLAEQYYVRLPDAAVVLDRFRPVFAARLTAAGVDRAGHEIVVSTFGRHYRMAVDNEGVVGEVRVGGPMQAPGAAGGCGVAPDALAALLFGPLGMHGLCRRRPDVYPGPDAELFETLFPPLTADLLTWYLPY